jgi:hypothetical protein
MWPWCIYYAPVPGSRDYVQVNVFYEADIRHGEQGRP